MAFLSSPGAGRTCALFMRMASPGPSIRLIFLLPLLVLTRRGAAPVKTSTANSFLANTREFQEMICSTGAKHWQTFCPSVQLLII